MGRPVVHFEVIGRDADALRAFYASMFGWRFDTVYPHNYAVTERADGTGIGGGIGAAVPEYSGHVTFYVGVDDVEATLAAAERLGGRRVMGPENVTDDIEIGQLLDPEGHLIGVVRIF